MIIGILGIRFYLNHVQFVYRGMHKISHVELVCLFIYLFIYLRQDFIE